MKSILASFLRKTIHVLIFRMNLYLLGMFFFRLSRKIRIIINKNAKNQDFRLTNNCLGNLKMNLDINSYMGGCIYWSSYHHVSESIYLNRTLKNDMNFIDIGANQGEFSLLASKIIKKGKILSFEPLSSNVKKIKKNVELNNIHNIEIYPHGLSDKQGDLPIYTSISNDEGGINDGLSTLYSSNSKSTFEEIVSLKVFDDLFFEKLDRIDFVKIDIEGSELFALKGMSKSLEKFKPQLLIEINDECFKSAGYSTKQLIDFLSLFNYKVFRLFRGNLIPHHGDFLVWGNYIFKSYEK